MNAGAVGFAGTAFDGRYVYLVPYNGAKSGLVTRYDTTALFAEKGSWSTFDLTIMNSEAKGFYGAAFDGQYVYLAPRGR